MHAPTSDSHPETAPSTGAAVRLHGVGKRFGARWALRDVDLVLPRGGLTALVGPNGAGKTTLLRLLAGLLRPTFGEVEVLGHSLPDEADAARRHIGFLAADGFLYDELTGVENLRFATWMAGTRPDGGAIAGALGRAGLAEAGEVRVRAYSTGMRRRLELARILLRPVELLLLDEPYAGLDRQGVALVDELLEEFRRGGGTAVLASHQPGQALQRADRAVALRVGRVGDGERFTGVER